MQGMMMGHSPTAAPGERGGGNAPADETLDAVLVQWQRAIWWTGVKPMLRRMFEANLTMAESLVLRSLRIKTITVAEAALHLRLSHSAASRAVDRLVRDGLIDRVEDPEDRRQKRLTITPQGMALVLAMEEDIAGGFRSLLEEMTPEDRETMQTLMARALEARDARLAASGHQLVREATPLIDDAQGGDSP